MRKLAFAAFLAMPGSIIILALLCLHPRLRNGVVSAAGLASLFASINRNALLLLLVVSLCLHPVKERDSK